MLEEIAHEHDIDGSSRDSTHIRGIALYDLDAKIRQREDQIAVLRKENDDVKFSNAGLTDRNNGLRGEIAAL